MKPQPLAVQVHQAATDHPFQVYECEHITDGSYPVAKAIPVGSHTNMALCKHCWQHVRGMAIEEMVSKAIHQKSIEEIRADLAAPMEKA
jgi:hypothetical protein